MTRQFNLRFTLFLFFSDLALVWAALGLATLTRTAIPLGRQADPNTWLLPLPVYVMGALLWGATFAVLNVYAPQYLAHPVLELMRLAEAIFFAWLTLAGWLYFTYRDVSRLEYGYFLLADLALTVLHRLAVRAWVRWRGGGRYPKRRVLIVGAGENAREIAATLQAHAWLGLEVLGFLCDNPPDDLPTLGTLAEAPHVIAAHHVAEVVIALPRGHTHDLRALVYRLQALPVNIRLLPDYFDLAFLRLNVENFGGMPLLSLKEPVLDPFQRLVKRTFDLLVTSLAMIPALPLMATVALAIRLDSAGPALFKQKRVGEGGRLFTMYKFRTMIVGAEALQAEVSALDADGNLIHKRADDPRVTRVGRFLRRTSLDELPQLFNVLRGEMSLVGPRPELPWLVERYEDWQRKRFEVPQGITGWWQVNGRADRPMHLHTEDDLYYIRNYSVWLDLKILWLTVQSVLLRKGAF